MLGVGYWRMRARSHCTCYSKKACSLVSSPQGDIYLSIYQVLSTYLSPDNRQEGFPSSDLYEQSPALETNKPKREKERDS